MNHCYSSATGIEDYRNYIAHVCQAYTGRNRPAACNTPPEINSTEIANSVPQVCYPRKCELDIIATRRGKGLKFAIQRRVNLTSLQPEEEKAGSSKIHHPTESSSKLQLKMI